MVAQQQDQRRKNGEHWTKVLYIQVLSQVVELFAAVVTLHWMLCYVHSSTYSRPLEVLSEVGRGFDPHRSRTKISPVLQLDYVSAPFSFSLCVIYSYVSLHCVLHSINFGACYFSVGSRYEARETCEIKLASSNYVPTGAQNNRPTYIFVILYRREFQSVE